MAVPLNSSKFVSDAINGLNCIHAKTKNGEGASKVSDLVNAKSTLSIIQTVKFMNTKYSQDGQEGGTIYYYNLEVMDYGNGRKQSAVVSLAHDLDHAWKRVLLVDKSLESDDGVRELIGEQSRGTFQSLLEEERRATFGLEKSIAESLEPFVRQDYDVPVKVYSSDNSFSIKPAKDVSSEFQAEIDKANANLDNYHNNTDGQGTKAEHDKIKKDNSLK